MQLLSSLIDRFGTFFFFLLLESISLYFVINNNNFHKSLFGEINIEVTGYIYNQTDKISQIIYSSSEIERLTQENRFLRKKLLLRNSTVLQKDTILSFLDKDSLIDYDIINAEVISNSISNERNFLTLAKGKKHGVKKDMGVISAKGVLGVVANVSENYSIVRSILNKDQIVSAKIKKIDYLGVLKWKDPMGNPKILALEEIPKNFEVKKGDSIVTFSRFHRFPVGLPIGKVKKISINQQKGYLDIDVEIFEDIAKVKNAYIIKNRHKKELVELNESVINESDE